MGVTQNVREAYRTLRGYLKVIGLELIQKLFDDEDIYVQAVLEFLTFDFRGFIQSNAGTVRQTMPWPLSFLFFLIFYLLVGLLFEGCGSNSWQRR
jgi:hypothetical protein